MEQVHLNIPTSSSLVQTFEHEDLDFNPGENRCVLGGSHPGRSVQTAGDGHKGQQTISPRSIVGLYLGARGFWDRLALIFN